MSPAQAVIVAVVDTRTGVAAAAAVHLAGAYPEVVVGPVYADGADGHHGFVLE